MKVIFRCLVAVFNFFFAPEHKTTRTPKAFTKSLRLQRHKLSLPLSNEHHDLKSRYVGSDGRV